MATKKKKSSGLPEPLTKAIYTPESYSSLIKELEPPYPVSGVGFAGYARSVNRGSEGYTLYKQIPFLHVLGMFPGSGTQDQILTLDDGKTNVTGKIFVTAINVQVDLTDTLQIEVSGRIGTIASNIASNRNVAYFMFKSNDNTAKTINFNPPLDLGIGNIMRIRESGISGTEDAIVQVFGYMEETDTMRFN